MATEKLSYEQFLEAIDTDCHAFVRQLHDYLLEGGCKPTFEAKKSGPFASYKHTRSKKSILNFLSRKKGMLVRIYAEYLSAYPGFLDTLAGEMLHSLEKTGDCKRLTEGTCSTKCSGYDFTVGGQRFQKCRYGCFEFLVTPESAPQIKSFVEHEMRERAAI